MLTTIPLTFVMNRLFKWFHKPHMDILEAETPRVHAAAVKAGKKLKMQLGEVRGRLVEKSKHHQVQHDTEVTSTSDAGRDFRPLEDHATLRATKKHQLDLVDLPKPDEGHVWYTNASGIHFQVTLQEREKRLAARATAGKSRPAQLDDHGARPSHYAALPFTFTVVVGIIAVLTIARAARELTVQRTWEWMLASFLSLALKWLVLDPAKVAALAPATAWAVKLKMRQAEEHQSSLLADMMLSAAAALDGGAGEVDRLRGAIRRVVGINRAVDDLQRRGILRATREAKERVDAEAAQRLEASLKAALSKVDGETGDVTTIREALHRKHAQQQRELQKANADLDAQIALMLDDRLQMLEDDMQDRASAAPDRQFQRMMHDCRQEASELEERAAESKARLEKILENKKDSARQKRERDQDLQMKARVQVTMALVRKHQVQVDAIVLFGRASGRSESAPLSALERVRGTAARVGRQTTVVQNLVGRAVEEEEKPEAAEDVSTIALRNHLQTLRPVALYRQAQSAGIPEDALTDALEGDGPKQALLELLILRHTQRQVELLEASRTEQRVGDDTPEETLRDQLWALSVQALHDRAVGRGIPETRLLNAMEAADPKQGLIGELVKVELSATVERPETPSDDVVSEARAMAARVMAASESPTAAIVEASSAAGARGRGRGRGRARGRGRGRGRAAFPTPVPPASPPPIAGGARVVQAWAAKSSASENVVSEARAMARRVMATRPARRVEGGETDQLEVRAVEYVDDAPLLE